MKCEYCGKITRDMPDHLKKSKSCHADHVKKLSWNLAEILASRDKLRETLKDAGGFHE